MPGKSFTEYAGIDQPQQQGGDSYADFLLNMMPMAQQQATARQQPPLDLSLMQGTHPQSPLGLPPGSQPETMPPAQPRMPMAPPMPQRAPMQAPMPAAPQQRMAPERGAFLAMMREGKARTR